MTDLEAQLAATRRDLRDRDATIHRLVNENRQLRDRLQTAERAAWPFAVRRVQAPRRQTA